MSYDDALERLDAYMDDPDHTKAPKPSDLKKAHAIAKQNYVSGGIGPYMINANGELVNEDGMIYAFPKWPDSKFHYNKHGDICFDETGVIAVEVKDIIERKRRAEEVKNEEAKQHQK